MLNSFETVQRRIDLDLVHHVLPRATKRLEDGQDVNSGAHVPVELVQGYTAAGSLVGL